MKRTKQTEQYNANTIALLKKRIAFHEAGHAVAIHEAGKHHDLPAVFFQITFNVTPQDKLSDRHINYSGSDTYSAQIIGGRLIENLPVSLDAYINKLESEPEQQIKQQNIKRFLANFETDILNFLIGPLAEAKYIAQYDDELFNSHLININTLNYFGGASDIAMINEYLTCFSSCKNKQEEKLAELLIQAFDFVNNETHWEKIQRLAFYIDDKDEKSISFDDISRVVNESN